MLDKYNSLTFGFCPNVFCNNQPVVPVGLSDTIGQSRANIFCPRCNVGFNVLLNWGVIVKQSYENYFSKCV